MNILETPRLALRPLVEADAGRLFEIYREPDVHTYFAVGPPESVSEASAAIRRHLLRYEEWGFGLWATVLRETNKLIGRCGLLLHNIDGAQEIEIAYLISRAHWGRGFASEAARGIRDYGFGQLKQEKLIAIIHADNERSKHVARAIGMAHERRTRHLQLDVDIFSICRPAFFFPMRMCHPNSAAGSTKLIG